MIRIEPTKRRWLGNAPLVAGFPRSFVSPIRLRRLGDMLVGGGLFVLTLPLMAVVAAAVRCESSGPIFCHEARIGFAGKRIGLVRFRTSYEPPEAGRPQLTELGCWLRYTRIDRLPLLLNVMRGELSAIGALPGRPNFLDC